MKRRFFYLIAMLLVPATLHVALHAQPSDQPVVIAAVAPFYPELYPPNTSGTVLVEVTVDAEARITTACSGRASRRLS
jgi:hypothetical protein